MIENYNIVATTTFSLYLFACVFQALGYARSCRHAKGLLLVFGFLAVCLHGGMLHLWIDRAAGQNLNFTTLLSLVAWLLAVLVLAMTLWKPLEIILMFVFPFAAISIVLVLLFPSPLIVDAMIQTSALFHIILSIITFCVLCFAGILAVALALQERILRINKSTWVVSKFMPLQSMELLLFQVISVGFILLSVLLLTSFYFYSELLFANVLLLQKTVLAVIAWLIFAILLVGRWQRGWRGRNAIQYTFIGVLLMVVVYFSSLFVLEFLH